ncbi:MAG: serine protease, partial [Thermosynechococcaceae cyanobacterium]
AKPGFTVTTGRISLISPKVLEGGYQLGYTNLIEKGMSGGPVLNTQGEVIAINGTHQEPLWGNPYRFADGTKPPLQMRPILLKSSWAIPMETFRQFADRLSPL